VSFSFFLLFLAFFFLVNSFGIGNSIK
jgi:hypothetical protein